MARALPLVLSLGLATFARADVPDFVDGSNSRCEDALLDRPAGTFRPRLDADTTRFLELVRQVPSPRLKSFAGDEFKPAETLARFIGQTPELRRLAIETWRARALRQSRDLARRFEGGSIDPATQFYNIAFIGAGSAEVTAQVYLANRGLRPKTITIEADEVVARTFYDTRGFYLNSTDGPSSSDERPLPNRGLNLNKIPGGFTQTSFVSGDRYAEAGVLGDILNINRMLIDQPILFDARVDAFGPAGSTLLPRSVVTLRSGRQIFADLVIESSGLGDERAAASSLEGRAFFDAEWNRFLNGGAIPRYLTAVRLFQLTKFLEQPYAPFAGKRILVNGDRDFAKVVWEFFERGCPASALKNDSAEVGRFAAGLWVGPDVPLSCDAYIAKSRTRYLRTIPGALQKGRIAVVVGRTLDVRAAPDGRVLALIRDATGVREEVFDFVVDAVGFDPPKAKFANVRDVMAELPDTGPAIVGRELYPGAYQIGVASGAPVTKAELAKNEENRASLFLNLVRVVATMDDAIARYGPTFGKYPKLDETVRRPLTTAKDPAQVAIALVNPDGFVRNLNYSSQFVDAAVASALSAFAWPESGGGAVSIYADGVSQKFVISDLRAENGFAGPEDVARLAEILTSSASFLSVLGQFAEDEPKKITWTFERSDRIEVVRSSVSAAVPEGPFAQTRLVRGFRTPAPVVFAALPGPGSQSKDGGENLAPFRRKVTGEAGPEPLATNQIGEATFVEQRLGARPGAPAVGKELKSGPAKPALFRPKENKDGGPGPLPANQLGTTIVDQYLGRPTVDDRRLRERPPSVGDIPTERTIEFKLSEVIRALEAVSRSAVSNFLTMKDPPSPGEMALADLVKRIYKRKYGSDLVYSNKSLSSLRDRLRSVTVVILKGDRG